jgi:hypothetical protein
LIGGLAVGSALAYPYYGGYGYGYGAPCGGYYGYYRCRPYYGYPYYPY